MEQPQHSALLSPRDVRVRLGGSVDLETVRSLMASGSIPSIDIGTGTRHHWRTTIDALDVWLRTPRDDRDAVAFTLPQQSPQSRTPLRSGGYRDWIK